MHSEVTETIVRLITDHLGVRHEDVTPASTFVDLDADSLDRVELVMAIEETFSLQIDDDTIEGFHTVQDVISYVERHAPAASA